MGGTAKPMTHGELIPQTEDEGSVSGGNSKPRLQVGGGGG